MRTRTAVAGVITGLLLAGLGPQMGAAQTQSQDEAPSLEQMRGTVSRLKGGRIATPTNYDELSPDQQAYVQSILSGPRSEISGPLGVMMVAPALGDLTQRATAYARFAGREGFSSVPPKLNELAILMVAKHWSAEYVWNAHHGYAVRMGLPAELVEAVRAGQRPTGMEQDVEAVYNFADEFLTTRDVRDGTLQAAREALGGDRGIVDLVGTMALYQISSMMVAVDRTPLPDGVESYFGRQAAR